MTKKTLAIGADHGGFALKETIKSFLIEHGYEYVDCGCHSADSCDYPDIAKSVIEEMASKSYEYGILICGTGIGISIAANRYPHIRAALCTDATQAKLTRMHNDANIVCLGARITGIEVAKDIVMTFLSTEFEGGRHISRIEKIETLLCQKS